MQDSLLHTFLNVHEMLASFLQEDVGTGDITSESIIPATSAAAAQIICKADSPAIVCGLEEAAILFDMCGCKSEILVKDGSWVSRRSKKRAAAVMKVSGNARSILKAERVALNLIMRMSGIATETRRLVDSARGVRVLATRKTAPGLRYFDKKAVIIGGAGTHRMRLDDMVLIKDNHLALAGSLQECIRLAKKNVGSSVMVECEVKSKSEAIAAVSAGADIIMLDNFNPRQAAETIRQLTEMGLRNKAKIEISGGINLKNIRQYAQAKPDFISVGYVTHSPKAIDFSLEMMKPSSNNSE